jgi:mannose-6-phosphate isomerase-like protein (cupin superfamily)
MHKFARRAVLKGAASAALSRLIHSGANAAWVNLNFSPEYELITKDHLEERLAELSGKNQNVDLSIPASRTAATASLVNEAIYHEREFEWHEAKDHIFIGLRGETVYEIGGVPTSPYKISSEEWRAPASRGAVSVTLRSGDMLTIPRCTPHRQSTDRAVAFLQRELPAPPGILRAPFQNWVQPCDS